MSTPTPRLLKDLEARAEKDGTKTGNGNGKPATNGALVVEKTPTGRRTIAAKVAKVAKSATKTKVPLKLTKSTAKIGKPSKMSRAKDLYAKMVREKKDRKAILAAFIKLVGLTKAGANTYYQLIRSKK